MNANLVLRHASRDDATALSIFLNRIADENLDTIAALRFTPEEEQQFLEKAAQNGRAFFLLALDGDDVVGVLDVWAGERSNNRHAGRLGMSVLARYRNQGLGRRMLARAIDDTRKWEGFRRIELDVVPWNAPAIRLYESAGFEREGVRRQAVILNDKAIDLIQMALVW